MIEMGLVVALGLIFMLAKLPWRYKMWMLSNPVKVDVFVFIGLNALHWGTFSGVMVAAIGALFCSLTLTVGRWAFGHVQNKRYITGIFNVENKL